MYQQLVSPNLSAAGRIGWCLEYAARVWGTSFVPDPPFAWTAWTQTKTRLNAIPTDVASICWFSFFVKGVNEGHVVASVPGKGFYSSPYSLSSGAEYQQGTATHAVLPSIAEVERIYGVKYVGCSGDILQKQVIKIGDDMPPIGDESTVRSLSATLNVPLTDAQITYYAARPYGTLYVDVMPNVNQQRLNALAKIVQLESQSTTGTLNIEVNGISYVPKK